MTSGQSFGIGGGGVVLDVQFKGLDEIVRQVNDPEFTGAPMRDLFREATAIGERAARDRAGSGATGQSILSESSSTMGRIYSTLPQPQANVIEGGRKPGGRMPPPDVITAWAASKGIDEAQVFPIARAIARRGLKGRFFMRSARAQVRHALPGLLQQAARDIVSRWGRGL